MSDMQFCKAQVRAVKAKTGKSDFRCPMDHAMEEAITGKKAGILHIYWQTHGT
jgi:hypothetical protein